MHTLTTTPRGPFAPSRRGDDTSVQETEPAPPRAATPTAAAGTQPLNFSRREVEGGALREYRARQESRDISDIRVVGLYSWTCRVVSANDETFTAEMIPDPGTAGDALFADFDQGMLERAVSIADVFYVTTRFIETQPGSEPLVHRSAHLRQLGRWRADELAEIRDRARRRWQRIQRLIVS